MQGRFSAPGQSMVHLRAILDQELTELPVPMKSRALKIEILSERLEQFAMGEQESDSAHIAIVGAPLDDGNAVDLHRPGSLPCRKTVKNQISASIGNSLQNRRHVCVAGNAA